MLGLKNSRKTFDGFTLAEVLVTLGIIGVISTLTLPTLMNNYHRKAYVTQLHKVYNEFSRAGESFVTSRNAVNLAEAGLNSQDKIANFMQSQMKIVTDCGTDFTSCFASSYKNINSGAVTNLNTEQKNQTSSCYALPSGASVCLTYMGRTRSSCNGVVNLVVDVNGKKGPNTLGRDLFVMGMDADGSVTPTCSITQGSCASAKQDKCNVNKSPLQKCKEATTMVANEDAANCFIQIIDDGWQMNY